MPGHLVTVELDHIEPHLARDLIDGPRRLVHEQPHRAHPRRQAAAQRGGGLAVEQPRAARIEDEADRIGADGHRRIHILRPDKAAVLHASSHTRGALTTIGSCHFGS
jgi:hypothetical protein